MIGRRLRSTSRALAIAAAAAALGAGCSVQQLTPHPSCISGDAVLLVAQSVPTATEIPCFGKLPAGWTSATVEVGQSGTSIVFASDRVSENAARMRFEAACDTRNMLVVESEFPGTSRHERAVDDGRVDRIYVFAGGCIHWSLDNHGSDQNFSVDELTATMQLIDREFLARDVRASFVDEEL